MTFISGFFLGLAYAMPIGSQNIFVINAALSQPRSYVTAAVVSIVDVILGLVCLLGVGELFIQYTLMRQICFIVGGIFLIYLAIGLLRKKEQGATGEKITLTTKEILTKSVLLTWLNPQALIDGSLLFGTYRALLSLNDLWLFACGIMVASPLWFFSLTGIVSYFGKKLSAKVMRKINICCAIFLCLFAFNMFSHVAFASESPVIRVTIVDNLMPYFSFQSTPKDQ